MSHKGGDRKRGGGRCVRVKCALLCAEITEIDFRSFHAAQCTRRRLRHLFYATSAPLPAPLPQRQLFVCILASLLFLFYLYFIFVVNGFCRLAFARRTFYCAYFWAFDCRKKRNVKCEMRKRISNSIAVRIMPSSECCKGYKRL